MPDAAGRTRVGIIGGGSIADWHLDGYLAAADRAAVTAIADIDPDHARHAADKAGGAEVFTDYQGLLASGLVDAVDICLPHHLHRDAIVAAAAAGLHVLCEKPLCLTLTEAADVSRAVAESGITLMCAHNQLYLPAVARARELVREGALGSVYAARTTDSFYHHDLTAETVGWRGRRATSGGGELIDTGYHPTYLLLHLVDSEPVEVVAMLSRHRLAFLEAEDSAQVLLRFADGSVGSIVTSWAYDPAGSTEKFSVVGDGGSLWSDGTTLHHQPRGGDVVVERFDEVKPHTVAAGVIDFVDRLRDGRRPLNTEVEGTRVLQVILAAYASADERRIVSLDEP